MNKQNGPKKEYNLTVAPLWETQGEGFISIAIKPDMYDALQKVKIGGKLLIKRTKAVDRGEKSPHAYLEYITPENVEEFNRVLSERKQGGGQRTQEDDERL